MRVAVLGMGRMGRPLAGRLQQSGLEVVIWNRSAGKASELVERGATEASSPAAAVDGAEVVITILSDDAAVEAAVYGESGIASGLGPDATYIDMSTVAPETAARLEEAFPGRTLASPVLGAPQAVAAGAARYLVGGAKDRFEAVAPVYQALTEQPSEQVRYMGDDVRVPLRMKLLSNYLLMSGLAVVGEVIGTAQALGIDERALEAFLKSSPLVAPALANRLDGMLNHEHAAWFTVALGAKDVRLAEEMAARAGVRLPIAELVKCRYEEAAVTGYAELDLTAIVELTVPPG